MSHAATLPGRDGRRALLRAGAAGIVLTVLPFRAALAQEAGTAALAAAIREAVGDGEAEEGGITIRAPTVAENGGQVPVAVLVDSPMTATDRVEEIHIFATRNPTPGIASFRLGAGLARAEVHTRIRLAEDQRILVLARHSDGRLRRAAAELRVTTGGCLS
jgi:sulfur-oxidizing protein SoxY